MALNGNACDDGHACTNPDTCVAGTCAGPGLSCPAPNECQTGGGCDDVSLGCLPLANKGNGTLCGAVSFCSAGDVFHPHQTCTTGACGSPATTACNGTCDPVTGCGGCNSDADCLAGNYCDNTGTCTAFKVTGTCNLASGAGGGDCKTAGCHECATNNCVDGFCCNSACGGGSTTDCLACNLGGSQGTCSPSRRTPAAMPTATSARGTTPATPPVPAWRALTSYALHRKLVRPLASANRAPASARMLC